MEEASELVEPPSDVVPGDVPADRPVCPYLRLAEGDALAAPIALAVEDHRCLADGTPAPQSLRQQELVCLRAAHVECPRFTFATRREQAEPADTRRLPVPLPVVAALLLLVLCAGISAGFVLQRGGVALPAGSVRPSVVALVTPSPAAIVTPSPKASAAASPSLAPTDAPPSPSPATPAPSPSASATATPSSTASIGSRVSELTPCPDAPDCYIYVVRRYDGLIAIGRYFGVSLASIYAMNPRYAQGAVLHPGALLRLPPPTR